MKEHVKLSDLVQKFGGELVGQDLVIDRILPLDKVIGNDNVNIGEIHKSCTFVVAKKHIVKLNECQAASVIAHFEFADLIKEIMPKVSLILCDNPYLYFSKVMSLFNPRKQLTPSRNHFFAIDESAQISSTAVVGDFVTIRTNTIVGDNVEIHNGSYVGSDVVIGANTLIYPNVTIMDRVIIGENCIVHSGAIIGADGFGNAQDKDRKYHKIPQIGGVLIGDWVEIGANSTIDSGTFSPTIIGTGVRIDNLVMIAHNVTIGDHTAIAACTGIAGSTVIGKNCVIAGAANITGHVNIVDGTMIGGSSNVSNDITNPGVYSSGFPSMLHLQWGKLVALFKKLPELTTATKELRETVNKLQQDVAEVKQKQ